MCRFLPRALSLETLAPANSSRIAVSAGSRLTAISLASLLALRQYFILAQLTISSLVSRRSEHNRSASSGSNTFSDNSSGHPHSAPSTSFVSGVYTHPAAASASDETRTICAKGFMDVFLSLPWPIVCPRFVPPWRRHAPPPCEAMIAPATLTSAHPLHPGSIPTN